MTTLTERTAGHKRRWRQYKARVKALPASHRPTVEAPERLIETAECTEAEDGGTRS